MNTYDVIVCGGGPSGVCAAIRAARENVKVLIIEQQNCLGGTWTCGLVSWFLDAQNKGGILREIIDRVQKMGCGRFARDNNFLCESEALKFVLDAMCSEAGVNVKLHTPVTGVEMDKRRITSVTTHSKSGKEMFYGKVFIDATGDGDVGYYSGCDYEMGHEKSGLSQPMTLMALVGGMPYEGVREYDNALEYTSNITPKLKFREVLVKAGRYPSQGDPALYHLYNDIYLLAINHEYGCLGTSSDDLTKATINARGEINHIVALLKKLGGVWKNIKLVSTAQAIGVREGRRISGLYKITKTDLLECKRFEDGICDVTFPMDIHSLTVDEASGYSAESDDTQITYNIPLRAVISRDVDNLMMAGRCISGDFYAHSSYRVTGNAAAIGEAVGLAAANAAVRP